MAPISVFLNYTREPGFIKLLEFFLRQPTVSKVFVSSAESLLALPKGCEMINTDSIDSGFSVMKVFEQLETPYLLLVRETLPIDMGTYALERLLEVAQVTQAGLIYSDYMVKTKGHTLSFYLCDYQLGSIRDNFNFGYLLLFSHVAMREAIEKFGDVKTNLRNGWYDLRLKLSLVRPFFHLNEPLYTVEVKEEDRGEEDHFSYIREENYPAQKELEETATTHLKRLGAFLPPPVKVPSTEEDLFPVEASVIIPVKNRVKTVREAIESALSQKTDFSFNILVIDNHSTDGTTELLRELSARYVPVHHLIPERHDLNIGGCWNMAIHSSLCGRYAVQLDSDDLYSSPHSLQKLIDLLKTGRYAMVIGSYTVVNDKLEEIPPGLVAHHEWSDENGHNNALRLEGFGAPRAYHTGLIRRIGFLNVSYGEDYAMVLRLSREYPIGRIYESLYLCRRWKGNSDYGLSSEKKCHYDTFKDRVRTLEIMARREINGKENILSL